ncbi:MAG: NAD(P)(+) transhydrogenase (Re/Si-specific) subunit beta [Myxococcales bacterium]|nr:NAD(P)(+) transhydrogenase (Re/Si-specific) subunit beta [Myxococcales bacterium]MCB9643499.1 NAD(P)(+) transhydrogenase (Re/Si-specific) subunit beta [Myxococcales bacterium]
MTWIHLAYMLASVLFIFGIKRLATVRTARQGNMLAMAAMLIAVIASLSELAILYPQHFDPRLILTGVVIGSAIGVWAGVTVEAKAMPEMVALLNGLGGAASLLVALSYFYEKMIETAHAKTAAAVLLPEGAVSVILSVLIGGVTVTGSVVAFGKLQGAKWMPDKPILLPFRHAISGGVVASTLLFSYLISFQVTSRWGLLFLLLLVTLLCLALGVLLVIPIGGADMPVVISLLNSYSGLAASMTGFVIGNNLLIISGSLVGASGIILTMIMCKAMNRSLLNVLVGGFGMEEASTGGAKKQEYTNVKSTDAEELAQMLDAVERVVIVPGYGMAVAQAQHAVREMADILKKRGVSVKYAIHPVAGRMPGHMNVLLAEADVPYDELFEMDDINNEFSNTDISIIIGANDVVNPEALDKKDSPIYGMPILHVHESRVVVIIKRSLSPGYAGIPNPLFEADNALMFFADARKGIEDTVRELKSNA